MYRDSVVRGHGEKESPTTEKFINKSLRKEMCVCLSCSLMIYSMLTNDEMTGKTGELRSSQKKKFQNDMLSPSHYIIIFACK